MSETEESDESENNTNECIELKAKQTKVNPNVRHFKSQFTPGSGFNRKNNCVKTHSYVRKRNNCLKNRTNQLSCDSIDGNDSEETVIDETLDERSDDWRNGPAKYWYDLLNLPEDCLHYDYGIKLRADSESKWDSNPSNNSIDSEDAFNLVSQTNWELNVIWDPDVVRQKVLKSVEKPTIAGWIPMGEGVRTAPQFVKRLNVKPNISNNNILNNNVINNSNNSNSILKISDKTKDKTNCEKKSAINGISRNLRKRKLNNNKICDNINEKNIKKIKTIETPIEDNIQWVSTLPEENRELVLKRWEDDIIWDIESMDRIPEPKIIPFSGDDESVIIELNHCLDENSNDSTQINDEFTQLVNNYNISNDEFYASIVIADNSATHSLTISHSFPALRLNPSFFPTCVQEFNRPLLKRSKTLRPSMEHNVLFCNKRIKLDEKIGETESQNSKDLSQCFVKDSADLTACTGDILLMEYSEEDPPLLMRVGMGSKLINYFKKPKDKNSSLTEHKYGFTKVVSSSPFIGEISSGMSQLSLETNMFRSPIFEHTFPETDFLIIRTHDSYYIREIDGLFVVGQQLPLMEVPRPKSKTHFDFIKQFAKMFIYRCFAGRKSIKNLNIELQKAFPNITNHFLTRILREFTTRESDRFLLKSEIPFDNQINNLLTPEKCCAYYSTSMATYKLRGRGYGDRLYLLSEDKESDNLDDLAIAPWNTTVSYIAALNTRKWLNVSEYNEDGTIVFANQSYKDFKDRMPSFQRCEPVTDRSLKRMSLKRAHEWLINYGMSKEKVKKLKNVIECNFLIKELSEKLRQNGVTTGMSKTNTTEQHYKFECQKIFDLQTSYYSSKGAYSTDEEEEEEEEEESDSDLEDMGKDLEAMILQNKTLEQIEYEREEKERKELIDSLKGIKKPKNNETKRSFKGMILKITRNFEMNGKTETRTEIVRRREVIEAYVRIRETKSSEFIKQLSSVRNHNESGKAITKSKSKSKPINGVIKAPAKAVNGIPKTVPKVSANVSAVCDNSLNDLSNIDINEEVWDLNESAVEEKEAKVTVDGSKLILSKKVVIEAIEMEAEEQRRLREEREEEIRNSTVEYFVRRTSNRCRIDPMVKLKDIFDKLIVEVRKLEDLYNGIDFFNEPVNAKEYPDYREIIKNPMDLKTIRIKASKGMYTKGSEFLKDIQLIYENSVEYNGSEHEVSIDAQKLVVYCTKRFDEMKAELSKLENMLSNEALNNSKPIP